MDLHFGVTNFQYFCYFVPSTDFYGWFCPQQNVNFGQKRAKNFLLEFSKGDVVELVGRIVRADDREKVIFWRGRTCQSTGLVSPDVVKKVIAESDVLLGQGLTLHLEPINALGLPLVAIFDPSANDWLACCRVGLQTYKSPTACSVVMFDSAGRKSVWSVESSDHARRLQPHTTLSLRDSCLLLHHSGAARLLADCRERIGVAKALFNYHTSRTFHLSFMMGDTIEIVDKAMDKDKCRSWWRGWHKGQLGWFPGSYVEEIRPSKELVEDYDKEEFEEDTGEESQSVLVTRDIKTTALGGTAEVHLRRNRSVSYIGHRNSWLLVRSPDGENIVALPDRFTEKVEVQDSVYATSDVLISSWNWLLDLGRPPSLRDDLMAAKEKYELSTDVRLLRCRAREPYMAIIKDGISFCRGQELFVYEVEDQGDCWVGITCHGAGLFPSNKVEVINTTTDLPFPLPRGAGSEGQTESRSRVSSISVPQKLSACEERSVEYILDRASLKELTSQLSNGMTALHVSCQRALIGAVRHLCVRQIDVDAVDKNGDTGLHFAVRCADEDKALAMVQCLLQAKADALKRNKQGQAPLHSAMCTPKMQLSCIKELTRVCGHSICEMKDQDNLTPFHIAALRGWPQVMQELFAHTEEGLRAMIINAPASPQPDDPGDTALHLAVRAGNSSSVEWLLSCDKVNPSLFNKDDKTAEQCADGKPQIQDLFKRWKRAQLLSNVNNGIVRLPWVQLYWLTPSTKNTCLMHQPDTTLLDSIFQNPSPSSCSSSKLRSLKDGNVSRDFRVHISKELRGLHWQFHSSPDTAVFVLEVPKICLDSNHALDKQRANVQRSLVGIAGFKHAASKSAPIALLVLDEAACSVGGCNFTYGTPCRSHQQLLFDMRTQFGDQVDIHSELFLVTTQTNPAEDRRMNKPFHEALLSSHKVIVQEHQSYPSICLEVQKLMNCLRKEQEELNRGSGISVLDWVVFKREVDKLSAKHLDDQTLHGIATFLHDANECIYFSDTDNCRAGGCILLDSSVPNHILAQCRSNAGRYGPDTGIFTLASLEKIYPKQGQLAYNILLRFRLAVQLSDGKLFIPTVLRLSCRPEVWSTDDTFQRYAGRRVQCEPPIVFTAPFIVELQAETLRRYGKRAKAWPAPSMPSMWSLGGFKLPGRNTEALVNMSDDCESIEVLVRGQTQHFKEMRARLDELLALVYEVIQRYFPEAKLTRHLLSSRQVKQSAEQGDSIEIHAYPDDVYIALCNGRPLPDCPENAKSLLINSSISCVLTGDVRSSLVHSLSNGALPNQKNWHDLAYQFRVPISKVNQFHTSLKNPADLLMCYLEEHEHLTIVKLLRELAAIGRHDCLSQLLEYHNEEA